jgi:oligogalacturonide lyase
MIMSKFMSLLSFVLMPHITIAANSDNIDIREWIDSITDHKVVKVSPQPYATLPYFTANAISFDQQSMVYISAKGLHLIDLKTLSTSLLVPASGAELQCIEMGRRTNRMFYLSKRRNENHIALLSIEISSTSITEHAKLPLGYRIESINSDETLAAGVREEPVMPPLAPTRPFSTKGEILYERVNAKIPMALFTVNLKSGVVRDVLRSSDWLSHPQFSPTDPQMLMYSLEGPWHLVDRIWTIRADGSERKLIHERTIPMEITGHEFWSPDGRYIHYDWQLPKGGTFYLASYDVVSGQKVARRLQREQWSVHFNSSINPLLFVGDGANSDQVSRSETSAAILLYRVQPVLQSPDSSRPVTDYPVSTEKLIDLSSHDYSLEPNARLTPDNKWVIFRSNLFGIPAVFAVQVSKSYSRPEERKSTSRLAEEIQAKRRGILMMN